MNRSGYTKGLWGIGLGAGLAGAAALALRMALKPRPRRPIPETISPTAMMTRVARTSIGQIVYHEGGAGETLLFLHGGYIGCSSYEWSKVYPHFLDSRRVLAVDLIGFGESERPSQMLGADEHVRALSEFIESTCARRSVTVVGSHLGGGLATLLASQHPDLVDHLVLMMPTGLAELDKGLIPSPLLVAARLPLVGEFLYRNALATTTAIRNWLARVGFAEGGAVPDEVVEVFTICAQQFGAQHAFFSLLQKRFHFDFLERLADLPIPVAFMWAAASPLAPLEWAYRLTGIAPRGSTLDILPQCAALAALENPLAVREAIASRIDDQLRLMNA